MRHHGGSFVALRAMPPIARFFALALLFAAAACERGSTHEHHEKRPLHKLSIVPWTRDAFFKSPAPANSILPFEDPLEALSDRAEDALHRALHSLLDSPLMDRAQARWNVVAFFEVLRVGRTSLDRT